MSAGLETRLKQALGGRSEIDLAQLQWLNLDMVKAEAGDHWIEIRKKIYNVAAHFIEKRLNDNDVLVRCRGGFVIVFAQLSGVESKERVKALSLELNLFFLGDQILKDLEITSAVRTVSAKDLQQFMSGVMGGGDSEAIDDDNPKPPSPEDAPSRAANWVEGEDTTSAKAGPWRSDEGAGQARTADWQGSKGRPAQTRPPEWDGGEKTNSEQRNADWQSAERRTDDAQSQQTGRKAVKDRRRKATSSQAVSSNTVAISGKVIEPTDIEFQSDDPAPPTWSKTVEQESRASDFGLPDAIFVEPGAYWDDIIFKPCWDAKKSIISTHFCLARRIHEGHVYYGRDTLLGNDSKELHRSLDRAVAIAAQRGFQQMYAEGVTCAIAIPVHYDTIQKVADRVDYFSILQAVPQHLRRYFFLRVDDIPDGAPLGQMTEMFRSMKCFGSGLLAKVRFDCANLSDFDGCGIDLFGSEVPKRLNAGELEEADLAKMAARSKYCHSISAETYLTQVADFSLLNAAVTAGVRYFAGEAVGTEVALPGPIEPCDFGDLHKRAQLPGVARKAG